MKIAFFVAEFPVLSETFVIRQVAGMVRAGHQVTVIAGQWGDRGLTHASYRENGLEQCVRPVRTDDGGAGARAACIASFLLRAPFSRQGRRALLMALRGLVGGSPATLLDLASLAGQGSLGRFDAIVAHFGPAGVRAMWLQKAGYLQGPLATVFHGFDVSDARTLRRLGGAYRCLFAHGARFLPISRLWRERLVSWGAPAARTLVLRMGVDADQLTMGDPARLAGRPLRALSVARFTEKKGLRYAIEGVCGASREVHYQIIGDGPLVGELKQLAAQAPPGTHIEFLGRRSQQEVFEALERADLFLLPSVTAAGGDMEGVPVALMEAMAKGIIVLATRHSGIPELVTEGVSGYLAEERSAGEIARAIDALPAEAEALSRLRLAARATIEAEFDNRLLDRQLERILAEMAAAWREAETRVAQAPVADAGLP
ncbi:MAG: glycosyltransferase [Rhodocyclaceae bacterium]|nr:glycosyltransferase [Rhodocyclaceae bacterium]